MKITGLHEFRAYIIETEDAVYQKTDKWYILSGEEWDELADATEIAALADEAFDTELHTITEGYPWESE